jgi:hypothetical protein
MIEGGHLALPIIHFDADDDWNALLERTSYLDEVGLDRLKRTLGKCVRCVAVELHYIDKDYRDTFSTYHSKRFTTPPARCVRLHFFDAALKRDEFRDEKKLQRHYIGYSVIRPTRPNCLGRTLVAPDKLGYVKANICTCEEMLSIQGVPLRIRGFPFISQDADVTVCAQSALWMLLRYFSDRYSMYREIYPSQITDLTRDYSIGRVFPSSGLTDWQMAEACRQIGLGPLIYSRRKVGAEFDHLLYTYVESGIPTLLSTQNHVVACFGHYSDYSKPLGAKADFLPSSLFNDGFIINDDNEIPYQRLGANADVTGAPAAIKLTEVESFTAPLPARVFLPAEDFEAVASALLLTDEFGTKNCSPSLNVKPVVTRTFLTTGRSFKRHLDARGMGHPRVSELYRNMPLPHFIWVRELSTLELYRAHQVLGEIIWDATRNVAESGGWLALHYPERLFIDTGSAFNRRPKVTDFPLDKSNAYPVMVHNLGAI